MFTYLPGDHSWVFGLVSRDDATRQRTLARHRQLLEAATEGLAWASQVRARAGTLTPAEPHLLAERDQAWAAYRWHRNQTIFGPLDAFPPPLVSDPAAELLYAPYVALYLRWETEYPDEWRAPGSSMWSPWTTKDRLLGTLGLRGVPESIRTRAADLVLAALCRPYRCKDWMYAQLVRHIVDASFVDRVARLCTVDDPLASLRARFVHHVARHPEQPVTRTSWRRWLAAED